MKYRYDLHTHSALSPCADNDMTPVTIVGHAALSGLHFVAVSDHNAIAHVPLAIQAGEAYGVVTVPAVEVQTNEDIHILCLFGEFKDLEVFYKVLPLTERKNRPDLFGEQLLYDEDDEVIGQEDRMLLDSCPLSSDEVFDLVNKYGGVAVPAHIDRDANSMLKILGTIPEKYKTVEFSTRSTKEERDLWGKDRLVIIDSDAHTYDMLSDEATAGEIELDDYSAVALVRRLVEGKR